MRKDATILRYSSFRGPDRFAHTACTPRGCTVRPRA
jgi:hypothetical protein